MTTRELAARELGVATLAFAAALLNYLGPLGLHWAFSLLWAIVGCGLALSGVLRRATGGSGVSGRIYAGAALACLVVGGIALVVDEPNKLDDVEQLHADRVQDMLSLRALAGLVIVSIQAGQPVTRSDALDVYGLVGKAARRRDGHDILRSARSGIGPTDAEVEKGDYTNFPWERYRGTLTTFHGEPVPLLWEKAPGPDGLVLVALSNGAVRAWDQATLDRILR